MPDVGRFFNVDPLAEDYPHWTPYAFSGNRVVDSRELEGLEPMPANAAKIYEARLEQANEMERQGRYSEAQHIRETADFVQEVNTFIISLPIIEIEEVVLSVRAAHSAGLFTRIWAAVKGVFSVGESKAGIAETVAGKVPNPYGKAGGPLHQSTMKEVEEELMDQGYTEIRREVMVKTPNGSKSKRFIDIEGKNPNTGEVRQVQIGKQNKNGTPVSRERKALDDIENETKKRPEFVPYNNNRAPRPGDAGQIGH